MTIRHIVIAAALLAVGLAAGPVPAGWQVGAGSGHWGSAQPPGRPSLRAGGGGGGFGGGMGSRRFGQRQGGYGSYPYGTPLGGRPATAPAGTAVTASQQPFRPPLVNGGLYSRRLYPQQAALYRIEVVSSGNVAEVNVDFPRLANITVDTLAYARTRRLDGQQYLTEFLYALTPTRPGEYTIPPVTVRGRYYPAAGRPGEGFRFQIGQDERLTVRKPAAGVRPWLAMNRLRITSRLGASDEVAPGQPLALTVTLAAEGATAQQLPSLAERLRGDDFRAYLESSQLDTRVARNGRDVLGTRVEHYTIVPLRGGSLRLPLVRVDWWNARAERAEQAVLTARSLRVQGDPDQRIELPAQRRRAIEAGGDGASLTARLSIPLLVILAGYVAWWAVVMLRSRHVRPRLNALAGATAGRLWAATGGRLRPVLARLSPLGLLRRLRHRLAQRLPAYWRVWHCVKRIEVSDRPQDWCQLFQLYVTKHLALPVNTPMPQIAEALAACNPRVRPERLRRLVRELEAAQYHGEPLDFADWKRRFRQLMRPPLLPRRCRPRRRRAELPGLRPGKA